MQRSSGSPPSSAHHLPVISAMFHNPSYGFLPWEQYIQAAYTKIKHVTLYGVGSTTPMRANYAAFLSIRTHAISKLRRRPRDSVSPGRKSSPAASSGHLGGDLPGWQGAKIVYRAGVPFVGELYWDLDGRLRLPSISWRYSCKQTKISIRHVKALCP